MRITVLSDHLRSLYGEGGGIDRCQWRVAQEYARRGHEVDFVTFEALPFPHAEIIDRVRMHLAPPVGPIHAKFSILKACRGSWPYLLRSTLLPARPSKRMRSLPSLTRYIRDREPDLMISAGTFENLTAILAVLGAGAQGTRLLVSERNPLAVRVGNQGHRISWRWRYLAEALRHFYPKATRVVAISNALARDIHAVLDIDPTHIATVHNPIVTHRDIGRTRPVPDHPWMQQKEVPVILAVGRLQQQKDFGTLLTAFSELVKEREARLIFLGDGPERENLMSLSTALGVDRQVDFLGYTTNVQDFMGHADVLVVSSLYEGGPSVIIEALASGCQVVSTDCPGSPREMLRDGQLGFLVPTKSPSALARATLRAIDNPIPKEKLFSGAIDFTIERAADNYLTVAGLSKNRGTFSGADD